MTESRKNCNSDEPERQVNVGFGADEEKSRNEKGWNVLQVVQVSSSDTLDVFIFLNCNVLAISNIFGIIISLGRKRAVTLEFELLSSHLMTNFQLTPLRNR